MEEPNNTHAYIRWIIAALVFAVFGFLLLSVVGNLFISEVVQEVTVGAQESERSAGAPFLGERAPHWELPDFAGQRVAVSDFLGESVVLTFWASWNSVAADQIKIYDEFLARNEERLFELITINNQEESDFVLNFMLRGGYQVRVLLDENGAVGERYRLTTLPVTYFIDGEGIVRDIFIGPLSQEMLTKKAETLLR